MAEMYVFGEKEKHYVKTACMLYSAHAGRGKEIPHPELRDLRNEVRNLEKDILRNFQVAVTCSAFHEDFRFHGTDVGGEIIRILFGERFAKIFTSISRLCELSGLPKSTHNKIHGIASLFRRFAGLLITRTGEFGEKLKDPAFEKEIQRSLNYLYEFLLAIRNPYLREEIIIEREMVASANFLRESGIAEQIDSEINTEALLKKRVSLEKRKTDVWESLKRAGPEEQAMLASNMLSVLNDLDACASDAELAQTSGAQTLLTPAFVRRYTLQRLAKQLREEISLAESNSSALEARACAYEMGYSPSPPQREQEPQGDVS